MGVNNRTRRAARAKQRAKLRAREQHARSAHSSDRGRDDTADGVASSLATAASLRLLVSHRQEKRDALADFERFTRGAVVDQQHAIDDLLSELVDATIRGGWTPNDFAEIAKRRTSGSYAALLLGRVAARTRYFTPGTVAPEWRAQLDGVTPDGGCREWMNKHALAWDIARSELIDLLVLVAGLPIIETLIPRPGTWRPMVDESHGVDPRILSKVRALLAKAEATDYENEADALTAKAQDLMRTYSIERALLTDSTPRRRDRPEVRRVWLDAPYVEPKATLMNQVASSNRCRCVFSADLGFVSLVGFAADLDAVELLGTSLLFQASRSMRAEGSRRTRTGVSRTRSFRQSFLIAYALRIGERLREASAQTETRVDAERGGALLPVLAARDDQVTDHAERLFPHLVSRSMHVSNADGYGAGRAAADQAQIEIRDGLEDAGTA